MSTQEATIDLEVIEDSMDRKGWPSKPEFRERGERLMAQWSLEDA